MGETVRSLLRLRGKELAPGQHWVCTAPIRAGLTSDITVMTPIYGEGGSQPLMLWPVVGTISMWGLSTGFDAAILSAH